MERSISVLSDLKDLSDLLAGAGVDQTRLLPHEGQLRLEMELTRACVESPIEERGLFGVRKKIPWVKSRLRLDRITGVSLQRLPEMQAQAPLLVCDSVSGGYTVSLTSPDGLRLSVSLEQLDGSFADIGRPVDVSV